MRRMRCCPTGWPGTSASRPAAAGSRRSAPTVTARRTAPHCPASCCRAWRTATATPSTGHCAAAPMAVAARLDPDSYLDLARATYAEMALSGVSAVGEFHYLHHAPGGARYADPNVMGESLIQAAADAGIRLTLLDTCYLAGGLGPDGHT